MKHTLDIAKFISEKFKNSNAITFANSKIDVRKSAQVRIKNEKPIKYYEISAKNLSSPGAIQLDDSNIESKANIGSLENQTLKVGDILFIMRTKFDKVKIVTEDVLSMGLSSVVATKGITIIRTGSIPKAKFLKFYLELSEIKNYINTHDKGVLPTGKISIGPEVINELLIPDVINEDLSHFIEHSDYMDSLSAKSAKIAEYIKKMCDKSKSDPFKKGIKVADTTWKDLENKLDKTLKAFDGFKEEL